MNQVTRHVPVLLHEVLVALRADVGGRFLDCTFGGGGHTRALLEAHPESSVVACDRDKRAIHRGEALKAQFAGRLRLLHTPFSRIAAELKGEQFDGILADLGLSTDQLHEERGFSFHDEAPLDMRMDEQSLRTASDIVNSTSERELYILLREGGVGAEAKAIARAIVASRPVLSTKALADLVSKSLRGKHRGKEAHPATVVFQAIRIAVNDELQEIAALLDGVTTLAKPAARLAVISFHSLEDQQVAGSMRRWEGSGVSASWPGARAEPRRGKLVTKKAILPSAAEQAENPASRSARLRVFEFANSQSFPTERFV